MEICVYQYLNSIDLPPVIVPLSKLELPAQELAVLSQEPVSDNTGIPIRRIAEQALLAPARCCLKNVGRVGASDDILESRMRETPGSTTEEQLVEKAFAYIKSLSGILRERFAL